LMNSGNFCRGHQKILLPVTFAQALQYNAARLRQMGLILTFRYQACLITVDIIMHECVFFRRTTLSVLSTLSLLLLSQAAIASGIAVQVQDATGKALPDVVVYAEPEAGQPIPKPLRPGVIEQRGLQFSPLVTVVQTGSLISFPNNDKVRHHIYSFSPPHKFDQKLYSGTTAAPQLFDKTGTVVLGCNIHDKMLAYVRIVDTPYYAKTDANGIAKIDLPGGVKYVLKAWHYQGVGGKAVEQDINVKAGEALTTTTVKLALKPAGAESSDSNF
jgi:plastocyanin